ncbi:MAG: hypothetical protein KatS3mg101_0987 [Patescibacteria group bacterium]|nr:MAG: hypothetical protein KatS3mg101_0987 [Patescibacteria group bacterium]
MTFEEFIKKYDGKGIDYDNAFSTQCVDLYRQYVKEVLGFPQSPAVEGAKDIWDTYLPEYYDRVENTPYGVPEKGDIVIWGTKVGKYGHVAVFIEGDAKRFKSFDQNFPVGSLCHIQEHTYNGVLGWLKPKIKNMDIPEWFKTLLQEANLSFDREGEFRAFWEKAKKYDIEIREYSEKVSSLNSLLGDKAQEVSMLEDAKAKLQARVDELDTLYNKTKMEKDEEEQRANMLSYKVESLTKDLEKANSEILQLKEQIKSLKDDNIDVLKKIPTLKLITEVFVRIFNTKRR